ncbi:MAG: hypothetical protein QXR81_02495 [Candidatus Nezhaarchaeales archaeon]
MSKASPLDPRILTLTITEPIVYHEIVFAVFLKCLLISTTNSSIALLV